MRKENRNCATFLFSVSLTQNKEEVMRRAKSRRKDQGDRQRIWISYDLLLVGSHGSEGEWRRR